MSGDINNITKKQRYTDKRILDMIKNYFLHIHWKDNIHLSHIYWSIVQGRKSKEKFLALQKLHKEENE
jgi:hypothetical protein